MTTRFMLTFSISLIFLIFITRFTHTYFESSTQDLNQKLNPLYSGIQQEAWTQNHASFIALKEEWQETRDIWAIFVDHFEIDNIEASMQRLETYIQEKNKMEALVEFAMLKERVTHLRKKEQLLLKNIL